MVIEVTSMKLVRVGRHYNFCALQYDSLYNQEATISRGNHNRCGCQLYSALHTLCLHIVAHLAFPGNEFKVHSKS